MEFQNITKNLEKKIDILIHKKKCLFSQKCLKVGKHFYDGRCGCFERIVYNYHNVFQQSFFAVLYHLKGYLTAPAIADCVETRRKIYAAVAPLSSALFKHEPTHALTEKCWKSLVKSPMGD